MLQLLKTIVPEDNVRQILGSEDTSIDIAELSFKMINPRDEICAKLWITAMCVHFAAKVLNTSRRPCIEGRAPYRLMGTAVQLMAR